MVVMPKQNVPALRLEGFSGEWELKAIGELFAERNESFPEGELLSVTLRNGIKRFQEIGRHNTSNEDKSKYKLVEVGDIAYNSMRMWQGASGVSPWKGIVSPAYTVLKPVGSQDTPFFAYYFKTPFMIQVFQLNSQGLTSDTWNLKYPALSAIDICRPQDIEEQQAIGAIFTNLDAAINQHTLKHKALQQAKTALMQRMFPQEGQTVPELRLEGFDGEWCIKSLDELATVKSAARVHREQWRDSGVPFFRASDVSAVVNGVKNEKAFISHELYEELSAKSGKLRKGDLLVIGGGSIGTTYQVPNDGPLYSKDADVLWVQPNANVSSDYLETFFGSLLFEKYLKSISHAGTIAHYTIIQAKRTLVPTPPTLAEQQAIGAVFTNLDQLIAAEAQYIKSLSQAKTALLQRMFI